MHIVHRRITLIGLGFALGPALCACSRLPDFSAFVASSSGGGDIVLRADVSDPLLARQQREALDNLLSSRDGSMLARQLPIAAAISSEPLVAGNRLTLLEDGPDIERAILQEVHGATNHVNIETYILADDEVGQRFADALIQKRREGVPVALIYDSFASRRTSQSYFDRLRRSGVRLLEFNPINPFRARGNYEPNHRDHRKVFIVDGTIAIMGGANIEHPTEVDHEKYWRDTDVRIDGPAVAQLQALFMRTWSEQGGEPLAGADYFPRVRAAGDDVVRVLGSASEAVNPIYLSLISAITAATRSIHLTTPYFAPDPQLLVALKAAARRGVDVELMLPSVSDFAPSLAAGRAHYEELLDAGVVIYEREHAWLHAKTMVIDNVWSTVGSTNLDRRSFLFNQEINAIMLGSGFAQRMERAFQSDRDQSRRISATAWRHRSLMRRVGESVADAFSYWW